MGKLSLITLGLSLLALTLSKPMIAEKDYRLPKTVIPINYKISLNVDLPVPVQAGSDVKPKKEFSGIVVISAASAEETDTLKLHADKAIFDNYDPDKEDLKVEQEQEVPDPPETKSKSLVDLEATATYDETTQIVTIKLKKKLLKAKEFTITWKYTGKLYDDNDMYGFYLSKHSLMESTDKVWLATTQFQPTYARRAFPCLDEPFFKATFEIDITHPKEYEALSNQPVTSSNPDPNDNKKMITKFEKTERMSTYLVAFVVSNFVETKVDAETSKEMSIYTRSDLVPFIEYAKEVSRTVVDKLCEELKTTYWDMGMKKLDQIGIPDFSAGAMENWGLVTYRESGLIWIEGESTISDKERVISIIAHEFAHNWFGNWVTVGWWKDSWLNEGFARYFEYHTSHAVDSAYNFDKQFIVNQLQPIMVQDGNDGSLPLSSDVSTVSEVRSKFGSITYSKGAVIVRMMKDIIGDQYYEKLGQYLKASKHGNVAPSDLFIKLGSVKIGEADVQMSDIMSNWVYESGYPVLNVEQKEGKIRITQKQFHYHSKDEDKDETKWYVKVNYKTEKASGSQWLKPADKNIEIDAKDLPIFVNPQQYGYYRVNYDNGLWNKIADKLNKKHTDVDQMVRAQIIDDAANLARADEGITYNLAFQIMAFLEEEVDYFPWKAAFNSLSYLRRRLTGDLRDSVTAFMAEKMKKFYEKHNKFEIAEDAKPVDIHAQVLALEWACELDDKDCYTKATELFDKEFASKDKNAKEEGKETKLDANLKSIVYCAALRHEKETERWQKIWDKYQNCVVISEKLRLLTALGCTTNEDKLKETLMLSIKNSKIRSQDALTVFRGVLTGNPEGVQISMDFLKEHFTEIHQKYGSLNALSTVIQLVADRLTTEEQTKEFEGFVEKHRDELDDAAAVADNAIEIAKTNIAWAKSKEAELKKFFSNSAHVFGINVNLFALAVATLFARYFF